MGIHGLSQVIADWAPSAIKENQLKNYFGRKIAIDASMSLYQFLIAVRAEGAQLTSADGETTSHLMGMFYRTIRLVDNGLKPIYVFDGKPPTLKGHELTKRAERREEAQKALQAAEEAGNVEDVDRFNRRLVKVQDIHTKEAKELLTLMGIPWITAPCEAEAQCAELVKGGKVFATATEDMDALTFGSNILLRRLTTSEARKLPVQEIYLDKILDEMKLQREEFIDLCIMLGCDYTNTIRGIGPKRAVELIKAHHTLENVIKNLDKNKFTVPENWNYKEARELFLKPEVKDATELDFKWNEPDIEGLVKFMCGDKQFDEQRIRNSAQKLIKARNTSTQGRLDGFFTVTTTPSAKRKADDKKGPAKRGRGAAGGSKFRGKPK